MTRLRGWTWPESTIFYFNQISLSQSSLCSLDGNSSDIQDLMGPLERGFQHRV